MKTITKDIEITGAYPHWQIRFKHRYYPIHIPTRMRPLTGDKLIDYVRNSFSWALAMRALYPEIKKAWDEFCAYNNWKSN